MIAWRRGSVPEVVADGVTGFVVESIENAMKAVARVEWRNRRDCRNVFEGALRCGSHGSGLRRGLSAAWTGRP